MNCSTKETASCRNTSAVTIQVPPHRSCAANILENGTGRVWITPRRTLMFWCARHDLNLGPTACERVGLAHISSDYERNSVINVQRKVWAGGGNGMHIGATKTDAREAAVTVIPVLKKILTKYKQDSVSRGKTVAPPRPGQYFSPRHPTAHRRSVVRLACISPWTRHQAERDGRGR